MIRFCMTAAIAATLFTFSGQAALADAAMRAIRGTVAPGDAVPPDAEAVVAVRGKDGVVVAEDRVRSEGREALPFEVWIPAGSTGSLEATLEGDGVRDQRIDPVELPAGTGPVDLGEIAMIPGPEPELEPETEREPEPEASAEAEPDPALAEEDREHAEAGEQTVEDVAEGNDRFRAVGRDPSWVLELDGQDLVLVPAPDADPIVAEAAPEIDAQGRLTYTLPDADVAVALEAAVCRDAMSGMPHPVTVTVTTPDGTYAGCGGEPYDLLAGGEWRSPARTAVAQIADPDAAVTLDFQRDGRVVGSTGCNPYEAPVTATSDRLTIGPVSVDEAECPDDTLATTERRFIEALETATRFDIAPGELTLIAGDHPVLVGSR